MIRYKSIYIYFFDMDFIRQTPKFWSVSVHGSENLL
jgi:hypothetical protein